MTRSFRAVGFWVSVLATGLCVRALIPDAAVRAQTPPRSEAQLLAQTAPGPQQVAAMLDLVKLYVEERRFDEAERMLARATATIQQQRLTTSQFMSTNAATNPGGGQLVRVGSQMSAPIKIKDVKPVYPQIALAAHVQGTVILEVIIGTDGSVTDAKVLRSMALLDQAALDAVRQWRYQPVYLNGAPVSVVQTVTVSFSNESVSTSTGSAGTDQPMRVGGSIGEPKKILDVKPIYPAEAQASRVQGMVIVEAVIDRNGNVNDAKVLRSVPLLDQAALDAVRQWRFMPTLFNGVPVSVIMTVTVNFSLQ